MSIVSILALVFTVLASVSIVGVIISLGWYLIWKTFLSKFGLVRELLGQRNSESPPYSKSEYGSVSSGSVNVPNKIKKIRKD